MGSATRGIKHPTSGKPRRTGKEAPYTSEVFEVDADVGTDSPLDGPEGKPETTQTKKE